MTTHQRRILSVAAIVMAAMLLFPPFNVRLANGTIFNLGYGFLFDPPLRGSIPGSVDIGLLLIQWAGVAIVAVPFWLSLSTSSIPSQDRKPISKWIKGAAWIGAFLIMMIVIAISKGLGKAAYQWLSNTQSTNYWVDIDISGHGDQKPAATGGGFIDFDKPSGASGSAFWDEFDSNNEQRNRQAEMAKVRNAHPGWDQTITTHEFGVWRQKQPLSVQKLADSIRAEDAILMLNLYKRDQGLTK